VIDEPPLAGYGDADCCAQGDGPPIRFASATPQLRVVTDNGPLQI
jgi:hypothetical protein